MKDPGFMSERELQQARRIASLILGFMARSLTTEEQGELDAWIGRDDDNRALFERLTDESHLEKTLAWIEGLRVEHALQAVQEKIASKKKNPKTILFKPAWSWVAASVLLIVAIAADRWIKHSAEGKEQQQQLAVKNFPVDFSPASNRATLMLTNGKIISLDSIHNGLIAAETESEVRKLDNGLLSYKSKSNVDAEPEFNKLVTPRGGLYQVTLADGTLVWLDAASSLRYPVKFTGNTRDVELTGEAYFEVAKNPKMPFRVHAKQAVIEVLGTHFNIMAYDDEPLLKASLLEGSIRISRNEQAITIKPLEQAEISDKAPSIHVTRNINAAEVLAWKDGLFHFDNTDLADIMRQLSRWYNVEVNYSTPLEGKKFTGKISRKVNASQVLEILQYAGAHFQTADKKIIVVP